MVIWWSPAAVYPTGAMGEATLPPVKQVSFEEMNTSLSIICRRGRAREETGTVWLWLIGAGL